MLAVGTCDGQIKIWSLKGYEQEINQAHDASILLLQFVPNQGLLLSVDSLNILKVWNLEDLKMLNQVDLHQEVSCFYVPEELTT